jgi:YD repeat-containing protein
MVLIPDFVFPATCQYDNVNRLTRVDYGNGNVIQYIYDLAGNRLTEVITGTALPDSVPRLTVAPLSLQLPWTESTPSIQITNTGQETLNWSATITTGGEWLTITSASSGVDDASLFLIAETNPDILDRTANVRVEAPGAVDPVANVIVVQAHREGLRVTMKPLNLPITFPGDGGSFFYDVNINNNSFSPVTADVGIQAVLPDGSLYTVLFLPHVIFPADSTTVRNGLSQIVPVGAPAGIYTYRLSVGHVGVDVISSDEFTFEKLASGFGSSLESDWVLKGWGDGYTSPEIPVPNLVLYGASPNPFNPQTTIGFELPEQGGVKLRVFDLQGRLIRTLIHAEVLAPGRHDAVWNGRDDTGRQAAAGVYFYRLEAGEFRETKRMVLVR